MTSRRYAAVTGGVECVNFTLTYDGPLSSGGNSSHLPEKQRIREALHPQIRKLWREHPALDENEFWKELVTNRRGLFPLGSFTFVPLVSRHLHLICGLDILFLRRERPGAIIHQGDIDNRLKILFDALRMPRDPGELKGLKNPEPTARRMDVSGKEYPPPFFCLLEDDSLITGVTVDTDQLLEQVAQVESGRQHVRLIMRVSVRLTRLTKSNMGFVGD